MNNDPNQQEQQPPEEPIQNTTPSTDEPVVQQPITESEIINPQSENKDMEVHHHAHHNHGKKTWKHYFWEFFMLFLAVFCGSIAELQLEHYIEKDRGKELAKSFYKELQLDSVSVKKVRRFILRKDSSLQYLKHYFKDSNLTNVSNEFAINFERGLLVNRPAVFEPRAAMLDLLINSGSLRYFKSKELQEMSISLSISIKEIKNRNERVNQFVSDKIDPFILQHFDATWKEEVDKLANGQTTGTINDIPFHLYKPEKIDKVEDINRISLFTTIVKQNATFFYAEYDSLNSQLQNELRRVYDLK